MNPQFFHFDLETQIAQSQAWGKIIERKKQERMLKQSSINHLSAGNLTLENKYLLADYSYIIQNTKILETTQFSNI